MNPAAPSERSTFVTALAWTFIALGGFATVMAALQNVMVYLMFPAAEMQAAAEEARGDERVPWFAAVMMQNFRFFFLAFLLLSAATLVSAIGLLRRMNWARILFVAIMGFGMIWNLGGAVLAVVFFSAVPEVPSSAPAGSPGQAQLMVAIMIGFNVLLALAFTGLFGWIINRLVSSEVRREFSAAAGARARAA